MDAWNSHKSYRYKVLLFVTFEVASKSKHPFIQKMYLPFELYVIDVISLRCKGIRARHSGLAVIGVRMWDVKNQYNFVTSMGVKTVS